MGTYPDRSTRRLYLSPFLGTSVQPLFFDLLKLHSPNIPNRRLLRYFVRGTTLTINRRGILRPDRLSGGGIHDIVTKLGTGSGIERRVRPHGIRHTAIAKASRLMKTANLGLPALQAFSNHRSPATLGRYIDPDNEAAYSLEELVSETASFK